MSGFKRLNHYRIGDVFLLSRILDLYLDTLKESALQVDIDTLSHQMRIRATIIKRLSRLHKNPADVLNIAPEDYFILFRNIGSRYPTLKLWVDGDGELHTAI